MKKIFFLAGTLFLTGLMSCSSNQQETGKDQTGKRQDTPDTPAVINKKGNSYKLDYADVSMKVNPRSGGRVTSLKINGKELLSLQDNHPKNWGSVFWTSPQKQWGWPPSTTFDSLPYKVFRDQNKLVMKSLIDTSLGYQLKKSFAVDQSDSAFHMRYTIYNRNDSSVKVAPWEVTRVLPEGMVFFPKGKDSVQSPFPVRDTLGTIWFPYDTNVVQEGHKKLIADGSEGWLGYVNQGKLFVKVFNDIKPEQAAPDEGEIEVYLHPEYKYIELEPQGAYRQVPAGDSLKWDVKWYIRNLPKELHAPKPGNRELLKYVRSTVKD